ncbi:hypothetical protein IQ264_06610 [Phormidium sp. LEGE 05292]|uniref:hypothetical protein n=1 Tax=[Phormidium] sp. LEGE 05292 TaxID=767427 RepID=UPI00187DF83A|nr:hypothetical protein [Phormidium sp. LEGE 05292]MBE9225106.1 hypothetical protein [Phormidium sp. LEGE 05292]
MVITKNFRRFCADRRPTIGSPDWVILEPQFLQEVRDARDYFGYQLSPGQLVVT